MFHSRKLVLLFAVLPAYASPVYTIFNNVTYNQTGSAAPVTPAGYWISLGGSFDAGSNFSSAVSTFGGPASPVNMPISGLNFGASTSFFASEAALHTQYPFGTYTYTLSGASPTATGTVSYTADLFSSAIPALSGGSYTGLQGLNPNSSFTVNFNSFTADPSSTAAFTFFFITDLSNNQIVYDAGFQPPGTTSVTIPALTFQPNHQYGFELDFSNRIAGSAANYFTQLGFDVRTDGTFTTGAAVAATPEPGTWMLTGIAGLMLLLRSARRSGLASR
jgi:hypothetical protein